MKKIYNVPSERYGHTHKFVQQNNGKYVFVPEEEWMPIYVTCNKDRSVHFIDTEGGPCIGVGFRTDEIEVIGIETIGNIDYFTLKETNKTED